MMPDPGSPWERENPDDGLGYIPQPKPMTTPTDKLVEDFAPLLYLEAGILDDKRLAAFLMRAADHIEHQAAEIKRLRHMVRQYVDPFDVAPADHALAIAIGTDAVEDAIQAAQPKEGL